MEVMTVEEFKTYIAGYKFTRKIKKVQLHHTYSPSYKNFNGSNHQKLQQGMKNYHIKSCGYSDIGQHLTIFPDGKILLGRSLNTKPAGIKNANTGAICIECIGNFDKGGDVMSKSQKNAIVSVVKVLVDKCGLDVYDDIVYHAWYGSDGKFLGDYYKSSSMKTCPGTNFFGGNTLSAYMNNLLPLLKEEESLKKVETINDIIWVLAAHNVITDSNLWMKKCQEDTNVYWLCYKMANKLQGTL